VTLSCLESDRAGLESWNPQNANWVVGITLRHDARVSGQVVEAPAGNFGRVSGGLLLNPVSNSLADCTGLSRAIASPSEPCNRSRRLLIDECWIVDPGPGLSIPYSPYRACCGPTR
jgi:hypothetical protein